MSDFPSPVAVLRAAAQLLIDSADAADEDVAANPYWRSEHHPPEHWFANGIDNACGGPAGQLARMFTPATAWALAADPGLVVDPAAPPVHLVTWTGPANNGEQSPRTTADNPPTSSDTPDNPLRDQS